ncbi:MAG: ImmA/IrrE family metallo-endopeptidase [Chloroflexi bacterium]|nr:ImmA/IrrE family metallo-endopeptidase [Chloroflexota bacterium]
MGRLAVEKAKQVHRRHPGLGFPLDMERLAGAEGCECLSWPFVGPVREVKRDYFIGLAQGLGEREKRCLIAHALAHHLMHTGNQLSFQGWQKGSVSRQEQQADECSAHILMPEDELKKVECLPVWEIAEHFGVLEDVARRRLTEFATDSELRRWRRKDEKGKSP